VGEERRDEVEALRKHVEELQRRLDEIAERSAGQEASRVSQPSESQPSTPSPESKAGPQSPETAPPSAPTVRAEAGRGPERYGAVRIDIGGLVNDVTESVRESVEAVMEGIRGEVERSVLIGPMGVYIGRRREEPEKAFDAAATASVLTALASEQRLRILDELSRGGKYAGELEQKLAEITASTLSSHLKVLQETGFVAQEAVRGRYLITVPGRLALQMASRIARSLAGTGEKPTT